VVGGEPGSATAKAIESGDLQPGDVIVTVEGDRVRTTKALQHKLGGLPPLAPGAAGVLNIEVERTASEEVLHRREVGAIQVVDGDETYMLQPCSASATPLARDECEEELASWVETLNRARTTGREKKETTQDVVVQQLEVELDVDERWVAHTLVLRKKGGLCFHRDADGIKAGAPPDKAVPMEEMRGARHAVGLDFYDGVIEAGLTSGAYLRIRVGHLNAEFHALLSAINVYVQP